jgi:hypothetical protein
MRKLWVYVMTARTYDLRHDGELGGNIEGDSCLAESAGEAVCEGQGGVGCGASVAYASDAARRNPLSCATIRLGMRVYRKQSLSLVYRLGILDTIIKSRTLSVLN